MILFLTNRITDLEEWNRGQLATVETAFSIDKANQYNTLKINYKLIWDYVFMLFKKNTVKKLKLHIKLFYFSREQSKLYFLISNDDIAIVSSEGLIAN